MTRKVIQVEKGSAILEAVITCVSKGAMWETDGQYWRIEDARPRTDNFVDIVLSDVY